MAVRYSWMDVKLSLAVEMNFCEGIAVDDFV
jgi:hypothetical protein